MKVPEKKCPSCGYPACDHDHAGPVPYDPACACPCCGAPPWSAAGKMATEARLAQLEHRVALLEAENAQNRSGRRGF